MDTHQFIVYVFIALIVVLVWLCWPEEESKVKPTVCPTPEPVSLRSSKPNVKKVLKKKPVVKKKK